MLFLTYFEMSEGVPGTTRTSPAQPVVEAISHTADLLKSLGSR